MDEVFVENEIGAFGRLFNGFALDFIFEGKRLQLLFRLLHILLVLVGAINEQSLAVLGVFEGTVGQAEIFQEELLFLILTDQIPQNPLRERVGREHVFLVEILFVHDVEIPLSSLLEPDLFLVIVQGEVKHSYYTQSVRSPGINLAEFTPLDDSREPVLFNNHD